MISVDYFYVREHQDSVTIDNEGDFILRVYNDDGDTWYLYAHTSLGWTTVIQIGSYDLNGNINEYNFTFQRFVMEFDVRKIKNIVDKFINDNRKCVTQAEIIEDNEEFIDALGKMNLLEVSV